MDNKQKRFRYFGYNTYRLITSGIVLCAVLAVNITKPDIYFNLPVWVYVLLTLYYACFPIKDMVRSFNKRRYKGKQFSKNYIPASNLDKNEFEKEKKKYDRGAVRSIIFWLCFMAVAGVLYFSGVIGREWIIFLSAMSDFCVYFAIFFWCPFHKILLKPHCCMDCRIFNWDSFFSFSFLVFIPSAYTYILFALGLISLAVWEINYKKQPERFYKISNEFLSCDTCDMEHCKNRAGCNNLKETKNAFDEK
ncbi:MAG: hypothetical protein ACI4RR_02565 [Eubacterium sp.]